LGGDGRQLLAVDPRVEEQIGALGRERQRDGTADVAAGAGDERGSPTESHVSPYGGPEMASKPPGRLGAPRRSRGAPRYRCNPCLVNSEAAAGELAFEVERARARRRAAGHRPEDLELEPVGILRVERQAGAVIRGADERARLDQALLGPGQIGQLADLPRRVIHARHALIGRAHARLLEQPEVVIVAGARDRQKGRVRVATLDLEADDLAVEAHAALDIGHPEHQVLQALEAEATHAWDPSTMLTVMATQAMSVSEPGTLRPPTTGRTVTSPCCSSLRTRSMSMDVGSGMPTVTSTSILPPRARTSAKSGRLEWRMASDTARHAALVPSRPWTSTPMPNSKTTGLALISAAPAS